MPRLLRFIAMKAADSPATEGRLIVRVSSPPGSFSTLITSAPMSASSMPQVGPAMICASSTTLMPVRGPLFMWHTRRIQSFSFPFELRLGFREESLVADLEVLGAEAFEALVVFLRRQRARIAQAAREFLVPARHQRRAVGDALGAGACLGLDFRVGHHARHQALVLRFPRVEYAAFEEDLQRRRLARERDERADLRVRHHQAELVDGHAEAAGLAADAHV